ncbi:SpoIIE family protein phosphatase [Methylobacterium sp. ID0610]|uniref:SpoIIE family protein phosphatase n=1 Tax=Methylobacterium carpenticola TaxID=3344827 RepID=UPI0036B7EEEF
MRIGAAWRAFPGETVCGDVMGWWREGAATLACIADGLGHGPEAHRAARSVAAVAQECAGDPAERLRQIDRAVRHTRGAAAILVRIDPGPMTLTVAATGNVQGALFGPRTRRFEGAAGIVGAGLRQVGSLDLPYAAADLLVLWTDGLRPVDLDESARRHRRDPDRLAALLLARFGTEGDDCAVLCIDFADGPG